MLKARKHNTLPRLNATLLWMRSPSATMTLPTGAARRNPGRPVTKAWKPLCVLCWRWLMEDNSYGAGFWLALLVGIIGVIGFLIVASGAAAGGM